MSALEMAVRGFAERNAECVVNPALGTSFDSLGEAYDFYNLYSWEMGFGIRFSKSRLNVERTKCMQEIVCVCSGKPSKSNSRSCKCPALIRLLRSEDNGWYICEHQANHNHSLSTACGEKVHWFSHRHLDRGMKDLLKQLQENNANLGKVQSIIRSSFGIMEDVPSTKMALRSPCGQISHG